MKRFDSEASRNDFKDLCTEVLPAIESIEQMLERNGVEEGVSIRVGSDGYLSMDVHNSKWRLARYEKDRPAKIIYEHSEEISIPGSKNLDKISENLVEISLVYASMQAEHKELQEIESTTWKQKFVEWANEFEKVWDDREDYQEAIEKYARVNIAEYAGLEVR